MCVVLLWMATEGLSQVPGWSRFVWVALGCPPGLGWSGCGLFQITPKKCPKGLGGADTGCSGSHRLLWITESLLSCGPKWGMLCVALGWPSSRFWGLGWNGYRLALGQASSTVLGFGAVVGTGFPLACTHCGTLVLDPRMLSPSGLVRSPGVGAHSHS